MHECLGSEFRRGTCWTVRGIVDQYIDCPQIRFQPVKHRLNLFVVDNIGVNDDGLSTGRLDRRDYLSRLLGSTAVVYANLGPLGGQGLGDRSSETVAAPVTKATLPTSSRSISIPRCSQEPRVGRDTSPDAVVKVLLAGV